MKAIFVLVTIFFLSSCIGTNEQSDEPLFKTSFDDMAGWVPEASLIYGQAHSGNYSIGVNESSEYSLMWKRTMNKISSKELKKLRISAFAKLIGEKNDACIVFSIDRGSQNLYWDSVELKKFKLNSKSWKRIESFLEIPYFPDSDVQLNIYLWGKGGSSALLDDMELEFSI